MGNFWDNLHKNELDALIKINKENNMSINAVKVIHDLDLDVLIDQRDEEGNPCYSVGQRPELSAGLRGFRTSPCFDTLEELYNWVNENEYKLMHEGTFDTR